MSGRLKVKPKKEPNHQPWLSFLLMMFGRNTWGQVSNSNENYVTLPQVGLPKSLPHQCDSWQIKDKSLLSNGNLAEIDKKNDRKIGGKNTNTENYPVQWDIWFKASRTRLNQISKDDLESIMTFRYEVSCRISLTAMCRCLSFIINMVHV